MSCSYEDFYGPGRCPYVRRPPPGGASKTRTADDHVVPRPAYVAREFDDAFQMSTEATLDQAEAAKNRDRAAKHLDRAAKHLARAPGREARARYDLAQTTFGEAGAACDAAGDRCTQAEAAYNQAIQSLLSLVFHAWVCPGLRDWWPDPAHHLVDAQMISQDTIVEVHRVHLTRFLSGDEVVGLANTMVYGGRGSGPGLLAKHIARREDDQTWFEGLSSGPASEEGDGEPGRRSTEDIADDGPGPDEPEYREQIARRCDQLRRNLASLPQVQPEVRQTVCDLIDLLDEQGNEQLILLRADRRWRTAPAIAGWFGQGAGAERAGKVLARQLLNVLPVLRRHGLDRVRGTPTELAAQVQDLIEYIDRPNSEAPRATRLTEKEEETLRELCKGIRGIIKKKASRKIDLGTVIEPESIGKWVLDRQLQDRLMAKMRLQEQPNGQNTCRQRVNRACPVLSTMQIRRDAYDYWEVKRLLDIGLSRSSGKNAYIEEASASS